MGAVREQLEGHHRTDGALAQHLVAVAGGPSMIGFEVADAYRGVLPGGRDAGGALLVTLLDLV